MKLRTSLLLTCVLLLSLVLAVPALAQPVRHKLKSGLTVITSENHEAPVATFQVWVRAGSIYERPKEYGITHLIEHMIFKGSPKDPKGEMAGRIEALGGEVNAYTTFDHTNYYVSVASRFAPQALELLADAVVNAQFDANELKREKEVVVEEIRMGQDSPARRRQKAVFKLAFGDHPYGRPVIGSEESVRAISRQDILDYRERWYRAPNVLVVAVGDFKTDEVLPLIEKAFADLPIGPSPKFEMPPVEVPAGPRLLVMREKVRQAAIVMSWRIPGLPSPEVYPLDVAAVVAGDGELSRLYSELKEKQGLVDGVGAFAYTPESLGLFQANAGLAPDKVKDAWRPLMAQTLSLISEPPKPLELERARVNLSAEYVRDRQTMSGQANTLGYFEMFRGGFEKARDYLERFTAVGGAEVAATLKEQLTPAHLSVVIQLPEGAPAPDEKALAAVAQELFAKLPAAPAADEEKAVRRTLDNGLTLVVQPRRAVPLVALTLAAPGGQIAENPDQAGLYSLWSSALTRGTKELSYLELTAELESMAGSISAFSGKTTCGLSGSFLSQNWERGLELFSQVWLSPSFEPEQVDKAKMEQLAGLRAQQDSPVARAFLAFRKEMYGDHPFAHNPLGSPETLKAMDQAALLAAHAKLKGPGGAVLTVVGDVDPQTVISQVKRLFGPAKGMVAAPEMTAPKTPDKPDKAAISDPKAKQTQIVLGYPAPSALDPKRHAMDLLTAVLGGMGGRLFTDLRDKRSLAYAVQPFYSDSRVSGVFGVYMGVGPGKEKEALSGLDQHLGQARKEPPSEAELSRAKNYLLGGQAIGLQTYGAQAMSMAMDELLGRGYDYYSKYPAELDAVSAKQVQEAAGQYLDPDHQTELTLGP